MKFLLALTVLFFVQSYSALAQATATFTASVTIIEPVGITTTSEMNFASVDARTGGEVVLTPDHERRTSGAVELADGGTVSAATFEVTGESGLTYTLSLPKEEYTLTNGSESIIIRDFTSSNDGTGLLAGGVQRVSVGATLDVAPNQTPGYYTSQHPLSVTVNYN